MLEGSKRFIALDEQADELQAVLERAEGCGLHEELMKEVVEAGGLGSPEIISAARARIRNYPGRLKGTTSSSQRCTPTLLEDCGALARALCARSQISQLAAVELATQSILGAVVDYQDECKSAPARKRGRGKPSKLKTPEAKRFISNLADVWRAYSDRTPRAGDGDTKSLNFNRFVWQALKLSGVFVSAYSVPRAIESALA